MTIGQLAAELPRYEICKTKLALAAERLSESFAALERHFSDAKPDRLDGLRLDWANQWCLVRASNTEPIVRIVAEVPTAAAAQRLCAEAAQRGAIGTPSPQHVVVQLNRKRSQRSNVGSSFHPRADAVATPDQFRILAVSAKIDLIASSSNCPADNAWFAATLPPR